MRERRCRPSPAPSRGRPARASAGERKTPRRFAWSVWSRERVSAECGVSLVERLVSGPRRADVRSSGGRLKGGPRGRVERVADGRVVGVGFEASAARHLGDVFGCERHGTAASLAVQTGAHVKAVHRMLGHASAAMTLDAYPDLFDDDLDDIAKALDSARSMQLLRDREVR